MTEQLTPETALQALIHAAESFGFDKVGVLDVTQPHEALEAAGSFLNEWLEQGFHGSMDYMGRHGSKRWRPAALLPGTTRVIALRMHYLNADHHSLEILNNPDMAYISRYALGRDYHKTFRQRLQKLTKWIDNNLAPSFYTAQEPAPYQSRGFVDSAPVMEKATAEAAALGWIGKNTLVIDKKAGSWFFLGEIYTNLPIAPSPMHQPNPTSQTSVATNAIPITETSISDNHCGSCSRCIEVCPTQAIIAPYTLDARKCISYLTIENKGPIPIELRSAIGNRIFGCDDCQLFCPWNRFAKLTAEQDFQPRHGLDQLTIADGLQWTAQDFDTKTQGSPIRRTGYYGWLRNLAVAAGNAPKSDLLIQRLKEVKIQQSHKQVQNQVQNQEQDQESDKVSKQMVIEHIDWALNRLNSA